MRFLVVAMALAFLFAALPVAAVEKNVLFIGNSHTAAYNLPDLVEGLAVAGNHTVHVDKSTVGGSTLSYHSHYQPTLDLIHQRDWDHVVLQEHSLLSVIDYWRDNSFYPSAAKLDSIIAESSSHTTLFMHWARKEPTGVYCIEDYCSREFADYFDMQAEMSAAYFPLAADLAIPLVPVGNIWAAALRDDPTLPLWGLDGLHSSPEGAYFTACVFYTYLFNESPVGLDFSGGLDAATALQYQHITWQVITGVDDPLPTSRTRLLPSYPNPFNAATEIRFELTEPATVKLTVFDAAGRRVRELFSGSSLGSGVHEVMWNGRDDAESEVPAGVYLLNLDTGTERSSGKLILVK